MYKTIFILVIIMIIAPVIHARDIPFTPLESHGIYDGNGINRKHQLLIEGRVKPRPF